MREISSCSCLTFLPGPAWVLLSKICKGFFSALYKESVAPESERSIDDVSSSLDRGCGAWRSLVVVAVNLWFWRRGRSRSRSPARSLARSFSFPQISLIDSLYSRDCISDAGGVSRSNVSQTIFSLRITCSFVSGFEFSRRPVPPVEYKE